MAPSSPTLLSDKFNVIRLWREDTLLQGSRISEANTHSIRFQSISNLTNTITCNIIPLNVQYFQLLQENNSSCVRDLDLLYLFTYSIMCQNISKTSCSTIPDITPPKVQCCDGLEQKSWWTSTITPLTWLESNASVSRWSLSSPICKLATFKVVNSWKNSF